MGYVNSQEGNPLYTQNNQVFFHCWKSWCTKSPKAPKTNKLRRPVDSMKYKAGRVKTMLTALANLRKPQKNMQQKHGFPPRKVGGERSFLKKYQVKQMLMFVVEACHYISFYIAYSTFYWSIIICIWVDIVVVSITVYISLLPVTPAYMLKIAVIQIFTVIHFYSILQGELLLAKSSKREQLYIYTANISRLIWYMSGCRVTLLNTLRGL